MLHRLSLERNAVQSKYPLLIFNLSSQNIKRLDGIIYKKREYKHNMLFNWYVVYDIRRQYDSVKYKLEMKLWSYHKIDCNALANVMRQRRFGKENVYCSNARFCFQWHFCLHVESMETFNTENSNGFHTRHYVL